MTDSTTSTAAPAEWHEPDLFPTTGGRYLKIGNNYYEVGSDGVPDTSRPLRFNADGKLALHIDDSEPTKERTEQ